MPTLHRRNGRLKTSQSLKVGDIVVLRDYKNERGQWPIGKIMKLLPRKRGAETTSMEVWVGGKTLVRSARGLCLLTPKT